MKHLLTWLAVAAALHAAPALGDEPRRVGIIGCDTSHVVAFTDLINAPDADDARAGFRVTAAFPGGSDDLPDSYERVAGYVDELRKRDVEIIESIDELVDRVDAILLESVDGRPHLAQFRAAARGKPVFIDKPLAASLADALAIFAIADATNTPCFSASGVRFTEQTTSLATDPALGPLLGAETASPYKTEPHHPDWFWYGIHAVEPLVALLGPGCQSVSCTESDAAALLVAVWHDGRLGTARGIKIGKADYLATAYGERGIGRRQGFSGYQGLVREICAFFATGQPPVPRQETIEILAIMEAAQESRQRGGAPVPLAEIIEPAAAAAREAAAADH